MWVLKTRENGQWIPWTAGANPSNINKLIDLHKIMYPGRPYVVDKVS